MRIGKCIASFFSTTICFVPENVNECPQELNRLQNSDRCATDGAV